MASEYYTVTPTFPLPLGGRVFDVWVIGRDETTTWDLKDPDTKMLYHGPSLARAHAKYLREASGA